MKTQGEINKKEILSRGVQMVYPSLGFVESKMNKGEKMTIYLGIDPTGPTLHLGHVIPLKILSRFQKAGHKVIMLLGDFTAMIGDPTDKSSARVALTHKQVLVNLKNYKKQASRILDFSGKNKAEVKFNSKWLGKMKFEDVLKLASTTTVQQMLERDMFEKRIEEGKPIFIHEFLYPLMQGYDSVAMDVDGEIGGNDQTFNMLAGRDLMKTLKNKEKFVITVKLLEDNTGKKMGKTEGNMIAISDSPSEMFGKVMSWNDSLIIPGFELCTDVHMETVASIEADIARGALNPRDAKMRLAREIITTFYGEKEANAEQENFISTFSKKEIPDDVPEYVAGPDSNLIDIFTENKVVSSKGDFRRLVEEGAITNLSTDTKINNTNTKAQEGVYRIGKKRFCKISFK
jgi:tyrosyl-tRNA synthetase